MLFLAIGLIGIGLSITLPNKKVQVDSTTVHLYTPPLEKAEDLAKASDQITDLVSDQVSFSDVHTFLNSDLAQTTTEVNIHGQGLSRDEILLLKDYPLVYHPSTPQTGITKLTHGNITEREDWTLQGQFQGRDVKNIFITTPDSRQHAATITDSSFQIRSKAPVAGAYLIPVSTVLLSSDTITDLLPIDVQHEPSWQMLVLSSYPSFEINYLKNYWTSLGNGFALRTKISKEKYRTSFVNSTKAKLDILTRKTLSTYDFIITDVASWQQLSAQEQGNIKRSVRDQGLALLIRPSTPYRAPSNLQLPRWTASQEIIWKTNADDIMLSQFDLSATWRSTTMQRHVLARYRASGLGHLAVLAIDDTYKLILANKEDDYQNLWSSIFSNLYRDFSPKARLLKNQWTWAEEKTTMTVLSNQDITETPILNDAMRLPFLKVPFLNGVTEMTMWPAEGYNHIELPSGSALSNSMLSFYAHPKDTWKAMKQTTLQAINQQAALQSSKMTLKNIEEVERLPVWWWYLLTLLGFGCLWFDERVYS